MLIYPAIDLYQGQAVRLYRGDYSQVTVYSDDPLSVARDFAAQGASRIHLVDLEGARLGTTPNFDLIARIKKETGLFCEVGGGVRTMQTVEAYLSAGIDRVILGTAAVTDPEFLAAAAARYPDRIAVGADLREGYVAIHGWTEKSDRDGLSFCRKCQQAGVKTLICTDVSKDGAMQGTNRALYRQLTQSLRMDIIASGGVSTLEDIRALKALGLHGAILGKAYYTGAIRLSEAIEAAR